ncbi:DDHD-domain-containing protein [Rhizodiscina lignyota]|uniref:DDHD-domain-containing protein n=1 Tax=Rhizodiscina lignyota TaxID=1504668 RepID=A0A9P4IP98_9PEZI|nr:DDHD-domain-containing protein [Rhizodiscina lignyota]
MTSTPDPKSATTLSSLSGITGFSPWSSRSATPRPGQAADNEADITEAGLGTQRGGDHAVSNRHRLSLKDYPRDCPRLNVQWFYAVDSPKRKPHLYPSGSEPANAPPPPPPKKYVPFSGRDSRTIEAAFQKLAEEEEAAEQKQLAQENRTIHPNTSLKGKVKVPVNEDYLFDVDVENRELGPAYWLGPVYDVRRGTWFYSGSAGPNPCDENLATQLEEGYLKIRPWTFPLEEQVRSRSASQTRSRPTSLRVEGDPKSALTSSAGVTPKASSDNLKASDALPRQSEDNVNSQAQQKTFRLFGAHMGSMVTYQDASTAWLLTDDFLSRMNSAMYERFAGGGHFAGVKITRGYVASKKAVVKDGKSPDANKDSTSDNQGGERSQQDTKPKDDSDAIASAAEKRRLRLERQLSSLMESAVPEDREKQEEEARKRNEQEMEDDYRDDDENQQVREIEHLILVTHGIGQRLGLRIESVNFVHDVNTMRRTFKDTYQESPDLQALNGDIDKDFKNSRIQVLPVCWRHLLDFPKQSLRHNREEHDLGDADFGEEDEDYPSLEDINVEGVPAVRNLITDLALDILLYQSPAYKNHISRIVLEECNRVYALFKERNPSFNGKVSFVGHSLGSAIMFDILCKQPTASSRPSAAKSRRSHKLEPRNLKLDFPVEDFYALGSPIGLFQMLKGRTIAGRNFMDAPITAETPDDEGDLAGDPFLALGNPSNKNKSTLFDITTSSPACTHIYNIFHPTDPIAYRLEPLISPAMAQLKAQPLPYTKKGLFGAPGQGIQGIGVHIGQSVSGLWSSLSSGIASSLLNRSLGLSNDQAGQLGNPVTQGQTTSPETQDPGLLNDARKRMLAQDHITTGEDGKHPPTLIDAEIETLYSGFQRQVTVSGEDEDGDELEKAKTTEEQARRLKREEQKVRALNSNGRVDYSIQEGAFDISLLASIASHVSYWADEDVSHFMVSQLLARHRVLKRPGR